MKAIDVSSAPPPNQAQIDCLKQQGVVKVIVGTSYKYGGDPAARIAAYEKGGFQVAEYQFPQDLKPLLTDEWWLDAEDPPGATRAEIRAACNRDPRPRGIYSSAAMWSACGLDGYNVKAEFPWLQCWQADYGTLPRPWRPFGGFSKSDVVMVQYQGNITLCSLSVDLNEIIKEDAPAVQEDDMKVVYCTDNNRIYLVGFAQPVWITSQAEVEQLVKAYGPQIALSQATINQMHT